MSDDRVIYDVYGGPRQTGDISEASPDALVRLALDGDESAAKALADEGLDFEKIFLTALENTIEQMKSGDQSPEEKDVEEVE